MKGKAAKELAGRISSATETLNDLLAEGWKAGLFISCKASSHKIIRDLDSLPTVTVRVMLPLDGEGEAG